MNATWDRNDTGEYTYEDMETKLDELGIISIIMFVIIFIGLMGNSAVMYIVVRHRDMHTVTNYFFANLAFMDFLFLVFHALTTSFDNIGTKLSIMLNCWPTFYLRYVVGEVTCLTLALMSYDRWRVVAYPLDSLKHAHKRKNTFIVCIFLTWVVSLAIYSPVIVYTTRLGNFCTITFPWIYGQKLFHTSAAILMCVIPLIFISVCYAKIWVKLKTSGPPGQSGCTKGQRSKNLHRSLRLILVVVLTFAVSWLLEHGIIVWRVWDPNAGNQTFLTLTAISKVVLYCNSAINPFIYPFAGTGFTQHVFCCRKKEKSEPVMLLKATDSTNVL